MKTVYLVLASVFAVAGLVYGAVALGFFIMALAVVIAPSETVTAGQIAKDGFACLGGFFLLIGASDFCGRRSGFLDKPADGE